MQFIHHKWRNDTKRKTHKSSGVRGGVNKNAYNFDIKFGSIEMFIFRFGGTACDVKFLPQYVVPVVFIICFVLLFIIKILGGRKSIENCLSSAIIVIRKCIIIVGPIVQFKFNNQHKSSTFLESWLTVTNHITIMCNANHQTEPTSFQSFTHGRMEIYKMATGITVGGFDNRCARLLFIARKWIDGQQYAQRCTQTT